MNQPLVQTVKSQSDDRMRVPALKRLKEIVEGLAGEPIRGPELEAFRQAYLDIKTGFGVIITLGELEKFATPENWFCVMALIEELK